MVDALLPGSSLGRYQMMERIGRGGMASVYRSRDPQLDRDVAVKVLPSFDNEDPTFVERFRREAQAVARLNHPNIIQVHDFGEDKGFSYIVMEYVTGGTLLDRIGTPLPMEQVLVLIAPVGEALAYAHRQRVVHRDIKPANVLLDDDGRPKLSDFGLARMLKGSSDLTRADSVLGTPEYMAPEQALGRTADQRSDLYSLGIIIYQMLLGQTPFHGKTPSETLLAHVHQPLPMPRAVDPDVDPRVEASLVKALAKDPDDRYQSPSELMEALGSESPVSDTEFSTQATVQEPVVPSAVPGPKTGGGTSEQVASSGISLDQACVLAMRTARETPGAYGRRYTGVPMAFEVVSQEETQDHYVVTLSFRPEGTFAGTTGHEQFFLDKQGSVAHRQVLGLPTPEGGRRIPAVPLIAGLAAVAILAVAVFFLLDGGGR